MTALGKAAKYVYL